MSSELFMAFKSFLHLGRRVDVGKRGRVIGRG